ncbi:putative rRNA biogenesis protein rrp5 [Rosellinia necatrix]|uniref:rRNA biogenesis protein RRP5 n=1 Tax=Rosellinia necatrix TaxID=77044 RepID=A0A1W2TLW8_ROSNE|nr:putative rRNA biogenesis protein rrp5 [Rosellinia necatrix]
MSSLKRKDAPSGAPAAKSPKRSKSDKPQSKPNANASHSTKTPQQKPAVGAAVSKLKEEEPLFPRGGGSVLSPLEHRQISIQAKQDVLFEQQSSEGAKKSEKTLKKKKSKASKNKSSDGVPSAEDVVRIESLNYQRLVKGSLVLAQITEIRPLELILALPNNLSGHVPITSVSDVLSGRVAAEADALDDDENETDGVDLKEIFEVGQYLRAHVVSTTEESSGTLTKPKKRIELSLRPEHTNTGLSSREIVENAVVMASVSSAEDHGYVMDLGFSDANTRGFLPRKEVPSDLLETRMQPGAVLLCLVTGKGANGKIIQLSALRDKLGNPQNFASEATTIQTFLPGSAVELMISDISRRGLVGKVMGSLDVTADLIHSGSGPKALDLEDKYTIGKKIKARVICDFPTAKEPKLGVSLLDHVMALSPQQAASTKSPLDLLPASSTVEKCTIFKVDPDMGAFVEVGVDRIPGFVHISRLKDGKLDLLSESSGPFKIGTVHRGRVLSYSAIDGVYNLSFESSVLQQPFLRVEDVTVGTVVSGEIEKLIINQDGIGGVLVKLAEGVHGYVPEMHLADVRLQHPEKKFREGLKVKARVLSTDMFKRQIKLTLKKTLVNSEAKPLQSFDELVVGAQSPAAIIKVLDNGAVVQFYGSLRGFLPVSEMSEAYIRDPKEHFRVGQVVSVHILNFDSETQKLFVSCKDPSAFGIEKQNALKKLKIGDIVSAKVVQKTEDDVHVELVGSSLKALLSIGQLTDRPSKNQSSMKGIRVGQILSELVVLHKNDSRRSIALSKKPSLVQASQDGKLLTALDQAQVGEVRQGFIRNITITAVFVQFPGQLTALLPKSKLSREDQDKPDFGLKKNQSIAVKIDSVDRDNGRLVVASSSHIGTPSANAQSPAAFKLENPVDQTLTFTTDLYVGKITKAKIVSIKSTQLNVKIADNIQGRVDVSQIFDSWDKIANPKSPLNAFAVNSVMEVRILGVHDAKNHRYLPISHRSTHSVLELSAKPSHITPNAAAEPSLNVLELGSTHIGFVNNVQQNSLWVNLSPNVRGRINMLEISDDVSLLDNLLANFPVGSALRVRVLAVNLIEGRLDLSARSSGASSHLTWDTIKQNMVLPGRVTKINERQIIVQLSDLVSAPAHLIDLSDDYDEASTMSYSKHSVVRVSVVDVDKSNKRLRLSLRPSRVLNSSLPIKDSEVTKFAQLNTGDVVRGFVKNVSDKGLFVGLGGDITAMVRISDLSDRFIKDWKDEFQIDQLVKGRIISIDTSTSQVQMSLKASVVDKDFVPLINYQDLRAGQIVIGKVRKVEEFGAFILIDGSANVSGLCHRSEIAEKPIQDAKKLLSEGDVIKAIVLEVDTQKKRVSLGLKPSYFKDEDSNVDEDESDDDDEIAGALLEDSEDEKSNDEDMEDVSTSVIFESTGHDKDMSSNEDDTEMADRAVEDVDALDVGGFDWSGTALDELTITSPSTDPNARTEKKKKRRKPQVEIDRSGDLTSFGPQTAVHYEQLLNRQPNSSDLWTRYMAFQMQVSELAKAREVAERAVATINSTEETEKLNVWIAYLNLEVRFGNDDTVDSVFKRACQVNDQQEIYQRLASIYVQDNKPEKADALFQTIVKKFGAESPDVWHNYAHWLHAVQNETDRARALLSRATQALPDHARLPLMTKFAALEYNSPNGSAERGRTMFEGLISTFPKRFDLWSQLIDHEDGPNVDKAVVRDVFDRATKVKGLKARPAKKWFKRWADWEEKSGDAKSQERVRAKATEWVRLKAEAKREEDEEDED